MNGHTIEDLPIAVDCFVQSVTKSVKLFFLTHMHSDHTHGLSKNWKHPIYCSQVTGRLLHYKFDIQKNLINTLEENQAHLISKDDFDITVTLLPANHCPGSCMFVFEKDDKRVLYTGDFRFETIPDSLKFAIVGKLPMSVLYLDNTYCEPGYYFPSRAAATQMIVEICKQHPEYRIMIGISWVGHEDMLAEIATALNSFMFVPSQTMAKLQLLEVQDVFRAGNSCRLNAVANKSITQKMMVKWNKEMPTIGIKPTAMFGGNIKQLGSPTELIYCVPYSNHCNYRELTAFVDFVRPCAIKPIVRGRTNKPGMESVFRSNMSQFNSYLSDQKCSKHGDSDTRKNNIENIPQVHQFERTLQHSRNGKIRCLKRKRSKLLSRNPQSRGVVFLEEDGSLPENLDGKFFRRSDLELPKKADNKSLQTEIENEILNNVDILFSEFI